MSKALPESGEQDSLLRDQLGEVLLPWARQKRWWPTNSVEEASVTQILSLSSSNQNTAHQDKPQSVIALLQTGSLPHLIQVPLLLVDHRENSERADDTIGIAGDYLVLDGVAEPSFWRAWVSIASVLPPQKQTEDETRSFLLDSIRTVRPLGVEQSNTSVLLLGTERSLIAKVYRVLQGGLHPEVELPSALDGWDGVPKLWAYYNLETETLAEATCSAVITDAVKDAEDGFVTLRTMANSDDDASAIAFEIGALIAQMHNRLEAELGASPGPGNHELRERLENTLRTTVATTDELSLDDVEALRQVIEDLTSYSSTSTESGGSEAPFGDSNRIISAASGSEPSSDSRAIRVHGDLHLGQLLRGTDGKWNVVDFEGEPLRALAERRMPDSPARDIAGMLRSFDYAAESDGIARPSWLESTRTSFLEGYQSMRPISPTDRRTIRAYELDKALYELQYEAQFRPEWIRIPMSALHRLVSRDAN